MDKNHIIEAIVKEVTSKVPVEALILVGSRAKGGDIDQGDYDVVAVVKTPLIPLYLPRLREVDRELTIRFGVKIEINPLLTIRIRRAKGNLFLMKLKKEGKLIYGKDYVSTINIGTSEDIVSDWYFSYLASLMKELITAYDLNGAKKNLPRTLNKIRRSLLELIELVNEPIANLIYNVAKAIMKIRNDDTKAWFKVRDEMINLFKLLADLFLEGPRSKDIDNLIDKFLVTNKGKSIFKNFEYAILLILKGEVPPLKAIFSRILVQNRLRAGLVLLLSSIKEDGIDEKLVIKAYYILKPSVKMKCFNSKDPINLWKNVKETILSYWSYAHTVMGL